MSAALATLTTIYRLLHRNSDILVCLTFTACVIYSPSSLPAAVIGMCAVVMASCVYLGRRVWQLAIEVEELHEQWADTHSDVLLIIEEMTRPGPPRRAVLVARRESMPPATPSRTDGRLN